MIPLNHKVEIEFGELMELVDKAKKLEALESRSCENCKYYRGIHKEDIFCKYWGYVSTYATTSSSMLCKEFEAKDD